MEKFIVSARKYRPQLFDSVVGQSHITTTLKNAILNNHLAHAFLFCGPRGVGKTTCARILAKTINCETPTKEGEACDKCQSCTSFNDGASMNYFELDAASNNSVENIRDLVDQVRFVPQSGKYKVYVIDEVHMLSSAAFNAFLKTLEEPPSYAIFILATTEKHKILPTILSRCQIFDFKRITIKDTVDHLSSICKKEKIKAEKPALQLMAQKSEGCLRDALSILDKIVSFTNGDVNYANTLEHLNILDEDYYFKLIENMQQQNLSGAMLLYDDINRKGFEGDMVLNGFAEFIRNLLVCKDEKTANLMEAVEAFKEKYISTAKIINAPFLISALNILNESEINYKSARNKRLHVELAIIKLCYLHQALELTAETNGLSKKKLIDADKPVAFRIIAPVEFRQLTAGSLPAVASAKEGQQSAVSGAKLIIETSSKRNEPVLNLVEEEKNEQATNFHQPSFANASDGKPISNPKLSALKKIQDQYKTQTNGDKNTNTKPLEMESLQQAWNEFAQLLKDQKNAAGQNFEMATLHIVNANMFFAKAGNNIQFRFIETTGLKATDFLKIKLQNSLLQFYVVMEENKELNPKTNAPLTSREQFIKLAEQYPLVKELKERLKLELDY
jgi:DNA polymerase-3 subunit gamma/tau